MAELTLIKKSRSVSAARVRKGVIFGAVKLKRNGKTEKNGIRKLWTIVCLYFERIRNFLSICSFLHLVLSLPSMVSGITFGWFADFGKRIYSPSIVIPTGCFRHIYSDARIHVYLAAAPYLTLFAAKAFIPWYNVKRNI